MPNMFSELRFKISFRGDKLRRGKPSKTLIESVGDLVVPMEFI